MLLFALILTLTLFSATSAHAISRATVLSRAQKWIDRCVPYSQLRYYAGYRTDCSGYASMCWQTGGSWNTRTFYKITRTIKASELKPGDALLHKGSHIRMFYGWIDEAHTMYLTYEQTSSSDGSGTVTKVKSLASDLAEGYLPTRYDHISDGTPSRNLLRNASLDQWGRAWPAWSHPLAAPVWWNVTGSREATLTVHRMDVVKGTHNSIELLNPSTSTRAYTAMSQELTVTPDTTYSVAVWARAPGDPRGLELSITYLDSTGAALVTTHTSGDVWGLDGSSMRRMSAFTVAPSTAARALVTARLAGGTTSISATQTVPGTAAVIDEFTLVRPQSTISMKANVTHSHIGKWAMFSGTVAPASAVGGRCTVWVQKPGSCAWVKFHNHTIVAAGSAAVWKCGYLFQRGMRLGVYRFKAVLPAFGYYLGATTGVVSVTLK